MNEVAVDATSADERLFQLGFFNSVPHLAYATRADLAPAIFRVAWRQEQDNAECLASGGNMKRLTTSFTGLRICIGTPSSLCTRDAQQKFKYSFGAQAQSKYTEQHAIEPGDVAGHQIRVATINTKYGAEAPTYDGVKAVESTGWLSSDYVGGSGRFIQYSVLQMENGDKIYSVTDGQLQTSAGKASFSTVTSLRGGTGKFVGIRGVIRGSGATDFKTGPSNNPSEGEYWFEK